ncbi:MAG: hypothetical protein JJE09_10675 [Bacteroidia bacterium]|nr:hypothetical protein [Bacteroidia bacterium]
MNRILFYLAAVALIASCSAPKYTYNFDHYNYNAGKKQSQPLKDILADERPQEIQPEMLIASATNDMLIETIALPIAETQATAYKKTYAEMNKVERNVLRSYLKEDVKSKIQSKKEGIKSTSSTKGMDGDLKLAAIFGAVGLVALIISGEVFYIIGGIALLIGVVFFVKWLIRQ